MQNGEHDMLVHLELMTVTEAAQMLRVSRPTVYKLIDGGDLPRVQIGRRKMIPALAVTRRIEAALLAAGIPFATPLPEASQAATM
jgi:excisionase family DNA binding protein